MNKLKEILDEFKRIFDASPMPENVKIVLLEHIQEKLVEYARSKVPAKRPLKSAADGYSREEYNFYECVDIVNDRIDQDLLLLKENNI